jgi:hypothetical protein
MHVEGRTPPPLDDSTAARATILAMCVRNALEGTLHGGELGDLSLTDRQMAILNPVVRNAVATGLHAERHYLTEPAARSYLNFQETLVPDYWVRPELLEEHTALWALSDELSEGPAVACRRCGREIIDIGPAGSPRWTHIAAAGGLNVGCRAATFTVEAGWDDDLPRAWKAAPPR